MIATPTQPVSHSPGMAPAMVPVSAPVSTPLPPREPVDEWSWLDLAVDTIQPGTSFTVSGVDWAVYQRAMNRRDEGRPGMRIHYRHGELAIVPTSFFHELLKKLLALLIECYCDERDIPILGVGGLTISQANRDQGFEPDESYYIGNLQRMLGKREIDLASDPPPDLTIEIEVTAKATKRIPVFASFRIPEVWRYDGTTLTILTLNGSGEYDISETSRVLPDFPVNELRARLADVERVDQFSIVRQFRKWLRDNS